MVEIKDLKSQSKSLEPSVRIGKNGLTDSMIAEIRKIILKKKLIKVKMLEGFIEGKDKKELAKEIAEKTECVLVDKVGNVVTLYRR